MGKKEWLGVIVSIGIITIVLDWLGIGCPIRYVTGISCAGCGMTRAWKSILLLDIHGALYYHPLFWTMPIIVGLVVKQSHISKRQWNISMGIMVVLFLSVYIWRLCDGSDSVVTVEPNSGLLGHYIENLSNIMKQ